MPVAGWSSNAVRKTYSHVSSEHIANELQKMNGWGSDSPHSIVDSAVFPAKLSGTEMHRPIIQKRICRILCVGSLLCLATWAYGQAPVITNISVSGNSLSIGWDTPTNKFIIVKTYDISNWSNASWCCAYSTGDVAETVSFSEDAESNVFYRLIAGREVVQIPDPNFKRAITSLQGASKTYPTNQIYYGETVFFSTSVSVASRSISNLQGIAEFTNMSTLYCYGNSHWCWDGQ